MATFHDAVVQASNFIRNKLAECDIGAFAFQVKVSGRTMTDANECKIEYKIGDSDWFGEGTVTGDGIGAVLDEYLRRKGWSTVHQPLALAAPVKESTY